MGVKALVKKKNHSRTGRGGPKGPGIISVRNVLIFNNITSSSTTRVVPVSFRSS